MTHTFTDWSNLLESQDNDGEVFVTISMEDGNYVIAGVHTEDGKSAPYSESDMLRYEKMAAFEKDKLDYEYQNDCSICGQALANLMRKHKISTFQF